MMSCGLAMAKNEPVIRFLSIADGRKLIINEDMEKYHSVMQAKEISVKTSGQVKGGDLVSQRTAAMAYYQRGILAFTEEEKTAMTQLVKVLHQGWAEDYPLLAKTPWVFLKTDGSFENGFPHTRSKAIVFSKGITAQTVKMMTQMPEVAPMSLGKLYYHEQLHVLQRIHAERFEKIYSELWPFIKAKIDLSHPYLVKNQLQNPDGVDVSWVFPIKEAGKADRYITPMIIFKPTENPTHLMGDSERVALELKKTEKGFSPALGADGTPIFKPLTQEKAYVEAFSGTSYFYHPNETFADLFPRIVVNDGILPMSGIKPNYSRTSKMAMKVLDDLRAFSKVQFGKKRKK